MLTFTRLRQDQHSEMYQVGNEDQDFGQLFVFFSPDFLFLDGYLYLNIKEDASDDDADDLADEVIEHYLNYHCPLDYGTDYTSFEVNLMRQNDSYLVEMGDEDFDDEEDECAESCTCSECE